MFHIDCLSGPFSAKIRLCVTYIHSFPSNTQCRLRSFKIKMCNILNLSLFLLAFGLVRSQDGLICYNCDPQNSAQDCQTPDKSIAPAKICRNEIKGNNAINETTLGINGIGGTNENVTYVCLSTYIQTAHQNTTGIIRDCYPVKPDVGNACELFREEFSSENVTVKSCHSCNSTRCNTILLFPDGTSGAKSNFFVLLVFVNSIFGIIITSYV